MVTAVRFRGKQWTPGSGDSMSVTELEFHATLGGVNLAPAAVSSASSEYDSAYFVENIHDEDPGSTWGTADGDLDPWAQLTLATPVAEIQSYSVYLVDNVGEEDYAPVGWDFEITYDANPDENSTWEVVHSVRDDPLTANETKLFDLTAAAPIAFEPVATAFLNLGTVIANNPSAIDFVVSGTMTSGAMLGISVTAIDFQASATMTAASISAISLTAIDFPATATMTSGSLQGISQSSIGFAGTGILELDKEPVRQANIAFVSSLDFDIIDIRLSEIDFVISVSQAPLQGRKYLTATLSLSAAVSASMRNIRTWQLEKSVTAGTSRPMDMGMDAAVRAGFSAHAGGQGRDATDTPVSGQAFQTLYLDVGVSDQVGVGIGPEMSITAPARALSEMPMTGKAFQTLSLDKAVKGRTRQNFDMGGTGETRGNADVGISGTGVELMATEQSVSAEAVLFSLSNIFYRLVTRSLGHVVELSAGSEVLIGLLVQMQQDLYERIQAFPQLRDIDRMSEKFITYAQKEVSIGLPETDLIADREFVRESKAWYSGKGTEQAFHYLAALTGTQMDLREPAPLIMRTSFPDTYISGALLVDQQEGDKSKLGRIRDGVIWSYYTYVLRIFGAQDADQEEFLRLIDLIHPAGSRYFFEFVYQHVIGNFSNETTFSENYTLTDYEIFASAEGAEFLIADLE